MKKIVGIILCLIVVSGAGYYLLMQKKGAAIGLYARYLPEDVVATVNLTHLNTITDTFAATALGRFLAKDTVHAILQELRVQPQSIQEYDRVYDNLVTVMNNPAFRAVFGDDATVALLPSDRKTFAGNPIESLQESLVVVAATSASGALDLFSRLVMSKNVTRETVDGLELTRVTIDQNQVIYGYTDEQTVLLAYSPAVIKACVAIRQAENTNTLEKTVAFKEAKAFWQQYPQKETFSRVFLNAALLADLLNVSDNPDLKQSSHLMQGIDSAVSITYGNGQALESRARTRYRYDQLHPLVKSAIDSASTTNQSLHLLQEPSLAYNWSSSLRPEMLMNTLSIKKQDYHQTDLVARDTFGVSLDQLGQAVGPQYGGVLDDIINNGLFPVPKMTLFLGIRDRKIAETALNGLRKKITEYGMAREEQEEVAGGIIYSWPVLPDKALQPAVVLTDSMLYLANNKQTLKDILTAKAAHDVLAPSVAEKFGPELSERVSGANFGSFVLYPQRMSRKTGDMIDWLAGILATTKNISISRLNREVVALMQSTELMAITTDLGREQADWSMTFKMVQTQPTGKKEQ